MGVVLKNGERKLPMVDVEVKLEGNDEKLTNRMKDELKDLKKANRIKENDKKKRIKVQVEKMKMEEDIAVWKEITLFKESMIERLNGNPQTKRYNIKQISAIPDFYEYQHPKITRQKTNDKSVAWVREYLSGGGTEKLLRETANESRVKVWRKIAWKRPLKETATESPPKKSKINIGAGGVG
jgi:hypothetical protein